MLGVGARRRRARSRSPRAPRDPEPGPDLPPEGMQPIDPQKDFRNYVSELFMENAVPGTTTQQIFKKASGAGARGSEDLGRCGASGKQKGNMHRDLMRRIMRGCTFPEECWAYVPVFNKATMEHEEVPLPVLLPHEVLAHFLEKDESLLEVWTATPGHTIFGHVQRWCASMGVDMSKMIPLGIHGDGVPFAAKMKDSLECISWNIITDTAGLRLLFTCFPKSYTAERHTWDCLFSIFSWSMRHLLLGVWPSRRHDGEPWERTDKHRARKGGQQLGFYAGLLQVRGDWAFYKLVFDFPQWTGKSCCWRCGARNTHGHDLDFRDASKDAAWRQLRYTENDFNIILRSEDITPSTLFSCPGLTVDMVMVDWLHTMDQGVLADVIGNVFWEVLPMLSQGNRGVQVSLLWNMIQQYYILARVPDRLDNLTEEMIKGQGKSPKQRGRAAQVRYLLPFAARLAESYADTDLHWQTVATLLDHLLKLTMMNKHRPYPATEAGELSRKIALLYTGLEHEALAKGDAVSWRCKPKVHLMEELIEYQCVVAGAPCEYWTYKDETWGAWVSKACMRRGGKKTATNVAYSGIRRFRYLMHRAETD